MHFPSTYLTISLMANVLVSYLYKNYKMDDKPIILDANVTRFLLLALSRVLWLKSKDVYMEYNNSNP